MLRHYGRPAEALSQRGTRDWMRPVAAYLARRWSDGTLAELARDLGLSRPDSVPNLTRRVQRERDSSSGLRTDLEAIEDLLRAERETKNKV